MNRISRREFTGVFTRVLALALTLSAGCSSPTAPAKPPKAVKTVAFIPNTASDFWNIARKGTEKADAELSDVNVVFKTPFGGTTVEQEKLVNEAMRKDDADAIAISPLDPAKQKKLINETAKRTLLITQDSDAPDTDRAFYVGADNRAAGRQAGEEVKKALPQGGKIMVFVGRKEAENAQDRFAGLKEALQGSNVEVIDILNDDSDRSRAQTNVSETLAKHPDIAGLVGLWSYNGPVILRAARDANKVGKVKIVCFDEEPEVLAGVKDGAIAATVVQQPFEYGYQTVMAAAKVLKGDNSVVPEGKAIFIPTLVVSSKNVDEFRAKLAELRGEKPTASPAASPKANQARAAR
jgi:ribose transport system substrate-binding protein